jgi:hypothetical protein
MFSWFVLKSHTSCLNSTRACISHTRECHTKCVGITLVHVQIKVVSIVITFLRAKITIRVEITLVVITLVSVKITLCV